MNKQKGSFRFARVEAGVAPILIIILIALAVGGYLAYTNYSNNRTTVTEKQIPHPSSISDGIVNWKTYKSEKYGFSFKYPSNWGEAYYLEKLKQVRIGDKQPYKLLINVESRDTGYNPGNNGELAEIVQDLECRIDIRTIKKVANNNYAYIYFSPSSLFGEEECNKIWDKIPESRIIARTAIPHKFKTAWLNEKEIPEKLREDYNQFKKMIDSFLVSK